MADSVSIPIESDADEFAAAARTARKDISDTATAAERATKQESKMAVVRQRLWQMAREQRKEAFAKLKPEEQLGRLMARRERIARALDRAGDNELRRLKLVVAQRQNEARLAALTAKGSATKAGGVGGFTGLAFGGGIKGLLAGAGLTVGTGAVVSGIRNIIREAGELRTASQAFGVSAGLIQSWRLVVQGIGGTTQAADVGLQRFLRRVGELQQGGGVLKDEAARLGISAFDDSGKAKGAERLLGEFAEAIKNARTEQERLSIAFKLFDSEGAKFVAFMRDGREALAANIAQARELGAVLEEDTVERLARVGDQMTVFGARLKATLGEAFDWALERGRNLFDWLRFWVAQISALYGAISGGASIKEAVAIAKAEGDRILAEAQADQAAIEAKVQARLGAAVGGAGGGLPAGAAQQASEAKTSRTATDQLARIGGFVGGQEKAFMTLARQQLDATKEANRILRKVDNNTESLRG